MARPGQPDIDDTRLLKAVEHGDTVQDQCRPQHPKRFEDQEQLGRKYRVDHKETVGDACKHLRPRERHKQPVAFKLRQGFNRRQTKWPQIEYPPQCSPRQTG